MVIRNKVYFKSILGKAINEAVAKALGEPSALNGHWEKPPKGRGSKAVLS